MDGFDTVILASGSRSCQPFDHPETLASVVHVIGDAKQVRNAVYAIYEAAVIASEL